MTAYSTRTPIRFLVLLVLVNLMWGTTFATNKFLLSERIGPSSLAFLRQTIATLTILPIVLWYKIPFPRGRNLIAACLLGFLVHVLAVLLEYMGTRMTTASNVAVLVATEAAQCMVLATVFRREKISFLKAAGFILCLGGAGVVLWKDLRQTSILSGATIAGDLLVLASTFLYALNTVGTKSLVARCHPYSLFAVATLFASLLLSFWAGPELAARPPWTYSFELWCWIFYLSIPCFAIPVVLYYSLLRHVSAGAAGCSIFLQTLFGVFFAAVFLRERPGVLLFVAAGMILTGLYAAVAADRSA